VFKAFVDLVGTAPVGQLLKRNHLVADALKLCLSPHTGGRISAVGRAVVRGAAAGQIC